MSSRVALFVCAVAIAIASISDAVAAVDRLSDIRARGVLTCGIWPQVRGFARQEGDTFVGFDVDLCRAVAAAIFGDATKTRFVSLAHVEDFKKRDDIDLVARRLTWTPNREGSTGMVFGPVTFFDGQTFLVPRRSGIASLSQLDVARICVINMERHPEILSRYLADSGRRSELVLVADDREAESALQRNRCQAYSADLSWLAAARVGFEDGLAQYAILPEMISKEPLAPLLRGEDVELMRVVRWTVFALLEAEEIGLGARNIDAPTPSSRVRSFLAIHPGSAVVPARGAWSRAVIASVGNYGEMFDRNLGANSALELERGFNRLWSDGGLMFSPPLDR